MAKDCILNARPGPAFWADKRVFLTGHTGFKGGWLSLWLARMGALVTGYSLAPPTDPALFEVAKVANVLERDLRGDIRDLEEMVEAMRSSAPEIVFHFAAQSLVRESYVDPIETYDVNVLGTAKVLEAVRRCDSVRAVVIITTDKCYENQEWVWPYRETDALGGHDPYSSSKGCAELVTSSYRRSFLEGQDIRLASARAGNVIGGGDWAKDRLLPDFLRAITSDKQLVIRSPHATRPWQHVLEPLNGYLCLAERLFGANGGQFADGWNFGPREADLKRVQWIAETLCALSPDVTLSIDEDGANRHEALTLMLSSAKAEHLLGWSPRWSLRTALEMTLAWNTAYFAGEDMQAVSLAQIATYEEDFGNV